MTRSTDLKSDAFLHSSMLRPEPMLSWRIARELYAFRSSSVSDTGAVLVPRFLLDGLEDAAGAYDAVEFGLSLLGTDERAGAIAKALDEARVVLASAFTTLQTEAGTVEIERTVEQARRAVALGCRSITLATLPKKRTPVPDPDIDRTVLICRRLSERLAPLGITLCWHPHQEHMIADAAGLRALLDETTESDVAVCLDLGWASYLGLDVAAQIDACGKRLRGCHVRDSRNGVWQEALGEGDLNLDHVLTPALRSSELSWISVELWFGRDTPVTRDLRENARVSADVLRRALDTAHDSKKRAETALSGRNL